MKLLNLYVFTRLFSSARSSLMPTKRLCRDCRHFIGDQVECRKFGDTDLVTGKVSYPYARRIREDNTKCGESGILFEENHFKIITVPYYFAKGYSIIFITFGISVSYLFLISYSVLHKP